MKKVICLLLAILLIGCNSIEQKKGGNLLPTTMQRKTKIIISHGVKTGFQMQTIRLHKGTGIDTQSGNNDTIQHIYCGVDIDDDFFSVRFYDSDGVTPIKHRRFNVFSGVSADFIIKIPSIPASGSTKITIAYAASGYTTESTDEALINFNIDGPVKQGLDFYGLGFSAGEPTVRIEDGKFKMWFADVVVEAGKPAPYGPTYPYTGEYIYYAESTDGKTWTKFPGTCVDGYARPYVYHHSDGYYYLMAVPWVGAIQQYDCYKSPTGLPGTWTLVQTNVLHGGISPAWDSSAMGNICFWYEGGEWKIIYEAYGPNNPWIMGMATGTNLTSLTKYSGNPIFNTWVPLGYGGPDSGMIEKYGKIDGKYYLFSHGSYESTNSVSYLAIFSSTSLTGPWTREFLLKITEPYTGGAQLGDCTVCEFEGKTYFFYTSNNSQGNMPPSYLSLAIWDAPFSRLVNRDITTSIWDDLDTEGWTYDLGYGEYSSLASSSPTTFFRKFTTNTSLVPISIRVKTDATHQLKTRKAINTSYNENTFYCISKAEQINKKFVPFRLDKDASNTILCGVWFDTDGNIKYYNGTTPTIAMAYTAQTYYKFTVKSHISGYDLLINDTTIATNIPYYSTFAKPQYFKVEQDLDAEGYINVLYTTQYSDIITEPTWGKTYNLEEIGTTIGVPVLKPTYSPYSVTNAYLRKKTVLGTMCFNLVPITDSTASNIHTMCPDNVIRAIADV